ncbi:MAG: methyltransferase domain-containing protein [Gammaproteobacteria bacterium]
MNNHWDNKIYSQFISARTRPAHDLLSVIPKTLNPKVIVDLGCGPGNSTILLKERWPNANVMGLDSSSAMINEAKDKYPQINFIQEDILKFKPSKKIDLIFANASLQWIPNHELLIPQLKGFLEKNGLLAVQMPNNYNAPSHQNIIQVLKTNPTWEQLLSKLTYGFLTEPLYKANLYYDLFSKAEFENLTIWETTYFQEMPNHQAIFEWVSGTTLQMVLAEMTKEDKELFSKKYIESILHAYPLQSNNKILFPFKRIFMVGSSK